jgi:hypothetical protein
MKYLSLNNYKTIKNHKTIFFVLEILEIIFNSIITWYISTEPFV